MISTIIEMVLSALVGNALGHFQGYLSGTKVRNVTSLFLVPEQTPDSVWCLCSHAMSFHSKKDGPCQVTLRNARGEWIGQCDCKSFVGNPEKVKSQPKKELEL